MYKRILLASLIAIISVGMIAGCGAGSVEKFEDNAADAAVSEEVEAWEDTSAIAIEGYNLLWHDEFEGDALNTDIWTREVREVGWTNNELQAYTDSEANSFVKDGCLVLKALDSGDGTYTSGKVNSQNKADFMYGKVVARAKVPQGKGLWPAIWMMPQDESYYGQ